MYSNRYLLDIAEYEIRIIKFRKAQKIPNEDLGSEALLSSWQPGVNVRGEHGPQSFAFNHFSLF